MSKLREVNEEIAKDIINMYKTIEGSVVGGYKKIEKASVDTYNKVADHCIDHLFAKENETVEEAKKRLSEGGFMK